MDPETEPDYSYWNDLQDAAEPYLLAEAAAAALAELAAALDRLTVYPVIGWPVVIAGKEPTDVSPLAA